MAEFTAIDVPQQAMFEDELEALGWELHDAVLLAKAAVTSQYGSNSDAIASLGLKKKGEYRRPGRRTPTSQTE